MGAGEEFVQIRFRGLILGRTVKGSVFGGLKAQTDLPIMLDKCLKKVRITIFFYYIYVCMCICFSRRYMYIIKCDQVVPNNNETIFLVTGISSP